MTTTTSPGHQFLDSHLQLIAAGKIDEMVDTQYTEDAVLITFFNGFETPPPLTIRGREAIKKFFHDYLKLLGKIDVQSLDLTETEDTIFFQSTFTSNLGSARVGDALVMQNNQIYQHFGFWA